MIGWGRLFRAKNREDLKKKLEFFVAYGLTFPHYPGNFILLGPKHNYDILNSINAAVKEGLLADDNKKIFSDKRFTTFKTKYEPYKKIYEQNKKHLKFANWHFESKLLGYSHSQNIRDIFKLEVGGELSSTDSIKEIGNNAVIRFVGTVDDVMSRTSRNGNKYARLEMSDEVGKVTALFMDSPREERYTDYIQSGNKLPKKGTVSIFVGKKNNDIVMVDKLSLLQDKIYMKLSELK